VVDQPGRSRCPVRTGMASARGDLVVPAKVGKKGMIKVGKGHGCPASKPWAVYNKATKHRYGCHASKAGAREQQKALYVHLPSAAAVIAVKDAMTDRARRMLGG
jgi:hypothetical protein